jgi:hypothetical protein
MMVQSRATVRPGLEFGWTQIPGAITARTLSPTADSITNKGEASYEQLHVEWTGFIYGDDNATAPFW